jgi:AdoMet-dependent rRNA methyltransferase SPB1
MDTTTPEIQAICEDLKVLGKGDFKALLKWRTAIREEVCHVFVAFVKILCINSTQIGLDVKTKIVDDLTEVVEVTEEVDEQQGIEDEVI